MIPSILNQSLVIIIFILHSRIILLNDGGFFDLNLCRKYHTIKTKRSHEQQQTYWGLTIKVKEWKIVKKESYETKWKAVSVPVWKDFESNYPFLSLSHRQVTPNHIHNIFAETIVFFSVRTFCLYFSVVCCMLSALSFWLLLLWL